MITPSPQAAMPADEVLDNLTPQQQAALDELVGDALADLLLTLLDRDPAAFRYVCTGEREQPELSGAGPSQPRGTSREGCEAGPAVAPTGAGPASFPPARGDQRAMPPLRLEPAAGG